MNVMNHFKIENLPHKQKLASLSLFSIESCGQATYMKIHPYDARWVSQYPFFNMQTFILGIEIDKFSYIY